jgi:glycosyltransferase involved in cell wall biosynthesis
MEGLHPELKVIKILKNSGLGNALNIGLEHCKFDLVVRTDSDDICKPNRMQRQVDFMCGNPQIDCCSSWIEEFIDSTNNVITIKKVPETSEEIFEYGKSRCPINHPAAIFRKQSVLNAGGYQHFPLFEDYYLWVRMLMNGCKMYNLQESLLFFRSSQEMFKRRGGRDYAKTEIKLNRLFLDIGYITRLQFLRNISVRSVVRVVPNWMRTIIYKRMLR